MGNDVIRLSRVQESLLVESVSTLLHGGIGLLDAYRSAGEMHGGRVRAAASAVVSLLERGWTVTGAVDRGLARIDPMHRAMLSVVDETGDAVDPMDRADRYLKSRLQFRSRVLAASIYPSFVIAAALVGSALLGLLVMPAAESLVLTAAGPGRAPGAGGGPAARLGVGSVSVGLLVLLAAGFTSATVIFAVALLARPAEALRLRLARLRLALPCSGHLEMLTGLLAFSHALAGLLGAGIPFSRALRTAADCPRNPALRASLHRAASAMEQGTPPSAAVGRALPRGDCLRRWFALCESGADLRSTVDGLASFLEARLSASIRGFTAIVEPVLVALAGGVVLTVVLTVVKPLFDLYAEVLP